MNEKITMGEKEEAIIFFSEGSPLGESAETRLVRLENGGYRLRMDSPFDESNPSICFNREFLEKIWFLIDRELFGEVAILTGERRQIHQKYKGYHE